jgi:hypothetical protein
MSDEVSRRGFGLALGAVAGVAAVATAADEPKKPAGPVEAEFKRDYDAPKFMPGWKKPQVNRLLVQDFVIYAHDNLDMVKKLLEKNPTVLNAAVDWGGGDWETALGGASHMGRRDIAEYLIEAGARIDLFASTMLGELGVVRSLLTLQPKLIDAKGPHGFGLHWHAHVGNDKAKEVLDYLQGLKKVDTSKFPKFGK